MPTTWARTVWLSGHPDSHAAVARRAAGDGSWHLCAVCAAPRGCRVDLRAALRASVGCGRPVRLEAYADDAAAGGGAGGAGGVAVPAPARVDCVCDPGRRLPLESAELEAGQAVLVIARPDPAGEDSDSA